MKRIVALVALLVILIGGVCAGIWASRLPRTYEEEVDATELYNKNGEIDKSTEATGIADVIVEQNLSNKDGVGTLAQNNVAAVVFDYRGFDTLGESFILLTAIAGSFVILSVSKKKKEDEK